MKKIVIAATVAAPFFANAWGLGDALNKVNDSTRKVQAVTQGVQDSAQGTQAAVQGAKDVPQAAASAVAGQAAALPWPMEKLSDYDLSRKVDEYLKTLGSGEKDEYAGVKALDKQLRDRAAADLAIVKAGGAGKEKAEEELDRYDTFLHALERAMMLTHGTFKGSVDEKGAVSFLSYQMRTSNSSVIVRWDPEAKDYFFYELDGRTKAFLTEADVKMATYTMNKLFYLSVFADKQEKASLRKARYATLPIANRIGAALKANSAKNVKREPLPKKGALHAQYAAEALAVARGTLSHPDAKEVFIDADDWTIDYKLGNPVRRRFGFWVLKDVEGGRKVFRMQACQDYQGGGKYGKLKYYAVGGGNYWVE